MVKEIHKSLYQFAKERIDSSDPSHDFAHVERVLSNCLSIGRKEGVNLDILIPAALLHDIVNVPKSSPDRIRASQLAADKAFAVLIEHNYSEEDARSISQVILEHSYSAGHQPSSLESAVLQDADRLDAMGAIGIMRTVSCGTHFQSQYYNPEDPFADHRELDDSKFLIDHFFEKLLKLEPMMNTAEGKARARARTQYMRDFLENLKAEISEAHNNLSTF